MALPAVVPSLHVITKCEMVLTSTAGEAKLMRKPRSVTPDTLTIGTGLGATGEKRMFNHHSLRNADLSYIPAAGVIRVCVERTP